MNLCEVKISCIYTNIHIHDTWAQLYLCNIHTQKFHPVKIYGMLDSKWHILNFTQNSKDLGTTICSFFFFLVSLIMLWLGSKYIGFLWDYLISVISSDSDIALKLLGRGQVGGGKEMYETEGSRKWVRPIFCNLFLICDHPCSTPQKKNARSLRLTKRILIKTNVEIAGLCFKLNRRSITQNSPNPLSWKLFGSIHMDAQCTNCSNFAHFKLLAKVVILIKNF